jgi:hypothetical protein
MASLSRAEQKKKIAKIDRALAQLDKSERRLRLEKMQLVAMRQQLASTALAPKSGMPQFPAPSTPLPLPPGAGTSTIELPYLSWPQVLQCASAIVANSQHPKRDQVVELLARVQQFENEVATLTGEAQVAAQRNLDLAKNILTDICRWAIYNGEISVALTNTGEEEKSSLILPLALFGLGVGIFLYMRPKSASLTPPDSWEEVSRRRALPPL